MRWEGKPESETGFFHAVAEVVKPKRHCCVGWNGVENTYSQVMSKDNKYLQVALMSFPILILCFRLERSTVSILEW